MSAPVARRSKVARVAGGVVGTSAFGLFMLAATAANGPRNFGQGVVVGFLLAFACLLMVTAILIWRIK